MIFEHSLVVGLNETTLCCSFNFIIFVAMMIIEYENITTSNTTSSRTASGKKRGRPFAKERGGRSERGSGDTFKEVQFAEEEDEEGGMHCLYFDLLLLDH